MPRCPTACVCVYNRHAAKPITTRRQFLVSCQFSAVCCLYSSKLDVYSTFGTFISAPRVTWFRIYYADTDASHIDSFSLFHQRHI